MKILDLFKSAPKPIITGRAITSPVAHPHYAEQLRGLQELNQKMFRSYDAAVTTNFNADFRSTFGSANAEILTSTYISRSRARTLAKDIPHGKAIIRTYQNNVVGHDPFRLKMRVGKWENVDGKKKFVEEEETNRMIEQEWEVAGWPENFSVRKDKSRMEAYRIIEAAAVRDGGILIRHHKGFPNNKYGYAIDLLEIDRLQESYMGKAENGNPIRFSIEFDKFNAPVAYWILTRHPGEVFGYNGNIPNTWRERVPAEDVILFSNIRDRAEQDVGFTELDSIMQHLHRDAQYDKALAFAAIASCCKPFWIKKSFPTGMNFTAEEFGQWLGQLETTQSGGPYSPPTPMGDGGSTVARQQNIGQRMSTEVPASTIQLEYGQELQQLDPRFPVEAAHTFKNDNLRAVSVGAGISYQSLSGDYQSLGFSAARSCSIPERDYFKVRQEHMKHNFVRGHFREWLRYAIMSGVLDLDISRLDEFVGSARFNGKRWPFINPLQDIQATILQLEAGLISPQQVQDEMEDGISIADLYAMLEEANTLQQAHGLFFGDVDVTKPALQSGPPGEVKLAEAGSGADQPKSVKKTTNPVRNKRKRGISKLTLDLLAMQGDGK
jgi:lambda family phage portal protein